MSHYYTVYFTGAATEVLPFARKMTLKSARFVNSVGAATHAGNYFTLQVYANDATEVMATFTNNSSGGEAYTAGVPVVKTLANTDEGDFTSSQSMKIVCALTGSGAIAGTLLLEFEPARAV